MSFHHQLPNGVLLRQAIPEDAPQMEALQIVCFPTLADAERFKAPHYRKHMELFPEGQIVALEDDRLIGATTTVRLHFDFDHIDHTFGDIIQGGWLTSHQPTGDWLYGADISTHPDHRGRGIGRALYAARQHVVHSLGLKGQVTAGMISGYGAVKHTISAQDYYAGVISGTISDPTLSVQMKVGFEPRALIANYLNDPACDNYGVLIVLEASKDITITSSTGTN